MALNEAAFINWINQTDVTNSENGRKQKLGIIKNNKKNWDWPNDAIPWVGVLLINDSPRVKTFDKDFFHLFRQILLNSSSVNISC